MKAVLIIVLTPLVWVWVFLLMLATPLIVAIMLVHQYSKGYIEDITNKIRRT